MDTGLEFFHRGQGILVSVDGKTFKIFAKGMRIFGNFSFLFFMVNAAASFFYCMKKYRLLSEDGIVQIKVVESLKPVSKY